MLGRKGALEWMEVMTLIFVSVAILVIALMVPTIIEQMTGLFALGSAEAVARDLGGLITISGAAFERAAISYAGADSKIVYTVEIKDRLVGVEAFQSATGAGARELKRIGNIAALNQGYSRIPFDVVAEIKGKNTFSITKAPSDDGTGYGIQVK
jgi:hypothetical protein